jgi:hypothetical protein
MHYLAANEMGDLTHGEAELFHTACDNINQLMELIDRRENGPPDPPGWEGGFAENH